ncbi:MAG: hypothetical protein G8D24_01815 [Buchnera aphidicola (Periphyllus lyropictus)]|uniref:hypothetical protein n=1 Tax=Buchnera aphidicola TaxID=9 RepID=UPI001EC93E1C|nr:hypothetical protein [Buchnera aphidicola (Periphyllus lyropictus)]
MIYFYNYLQGKINLLLTTYFRNVSHNLNFINDLSINRLHIDLISVDYNLKNFNKNLFKNLFYL